MVELGEAMAKQLAVDNCRDVANGLHVDLLGFGGLPQALDEVIVPPAPLPSILIAIPWAASDCMNSVEVNWLPWWRMAAWTSGATVRQVEDLPGAVTRQDFSLSVTAKIIRPWS